MLDERKHIDNYFADSLGEHTNENLDLDLNWNAVEKELDKFSFFRFQMNRFNIYYLGAIFINIAVLIWVIGYKLETPVESFDPNVSTNLIDSDSTLNSDLTIESSSKTSKSKKVFLSNSKNPTQLNSNDKGVDTSKVDNNNPTTIDGESNIILETVSSPTKADSLGIKKIKPPIVINRKRDTIIQVDTLFVNKKRKLKNK